MHDCYLSSNVLFMLLIILTIKYITFINEKQWNLELEKCQIIVGEQSNC